MVLAGVKNDLKTLFLILNTLVGLFPGLLSVAFGISIGAATNLRYGAAEFSILLILGVLTLGVTALGYFGTIKDNKIMLYIYSGVMVLSAVGDVVGLVAIENRDVLLMSATIVHLVGVLLTIALAVILAGGRRDSDQGCVLSGAPTSYTPNI